MGKMIRENPEALAALYTDIANQTIRELPQGWMRVVIGLAIDNKGYETFLVYYSMDRGESFRDFIAESFDFDEPAEGLFEAKELCQKLHELCKRYGDDWRQFALTVDCNGSFTADFNYEPMETFSNLHLRVWRGRYLH